MKRTINKNNMDTMSVEEMKKEYERLSNRYVPPHSKVAREVTNADIERVISEAKECYKLCFIRRGDYLNAYAIAHPQIDDKDPLRFFVMRTGEVYVNPVLLRHVNTIAIEKEGCMSYPDKPEVYVTRFTKLTVQYDVIDYKTNTISGVVTKELRGKDARAFQHECEHLDGLSIYGKSE